MYNNWFGERRGRFMLPYSRKTIWLAEFFQTWRWLDDDVKSTYHVETFFELSESAFLNDLEPITLLRLSLSARNIEVIFWQIILKTASSDPRKQVWKSLAYVLSRYRYSTSCWWIPSDSVFFNITLRRCMVKRSIKFSNFGTVLNNRQVKHLMRLASFSSSKFWEEHATSNHKRNR